MSTGGIAELALAVDLAEACVDSLDAWTRFAETDDDHDYRQAELATKRRRELTEQYRDMTERNQCA